MSEPFLFDLSIVIPSFDRPDALLATLMGIERATHGSHEVIVVDGGDDRATDGVLMLASSLMRGRLRVVRDPACVGLGAACNKAVRVARGRHVCVLADDVRPRDGALDRAVAQLDEVDDAGRSILALFAPPDASTDVAIERELDGRSVAVGHLRGTLVAAYPVARREAFRALPFDVTLASAAAIIDFSLAAWNGGHRVRGATGAAVERHAEARVVPGEREEHAWVIARWDLPREGTAFAAARPCTLHRRTVARRAA